MRKIIGNELEKLIDLQIESMFDLCVINRLEQSKDSYGGLIKSYVPYSGISGSGIPCGIKINSASKTYPSDLTVIDKEISVRLPLEELNNFTEDDLIEVIERNGESVSGIFYGIQGIQRGVTCTLVTCKFISA
jgi:hypothetical protein